VARSRSLLRRRSHFATYCFVKTNVNPDSTATSVFPLIVPVSTVPSFDRSAMVDPLRV
jgi:hypothetical protein